MFNKKKLITSVILIFMLLCASLQTGLLIAEPANQSDKNEQDSLPVSLDSQSAVVMDALTGQILLGQDIHAKLYPASTTKLMTLLLAIEAIREGKADWEDKVTASKLAESYGGSQIYLAEAEVLPLRELLLGIALASGNDAAVAIAEYLGGTHEGFVEKMNQRALELGMKNTHFVNANGLHDEEHYTTAYDLSLLGRKAASYKELLEITSTKHYQIRKDTDKPFNFDNNNKLLWQFEGAQGLKTGWTEDANYCFVAAATRNGLQLISVVMNNSKPMGHMEDSKKLLNWAYNSYIKYKPAPQEIPRIIFNVNKGKANIVEGTLPSNWGIPLLKGTSPNLHYRWEGPDHFHAPIEQGELLGYLQVAGDDNKTIFKLSVVASEAIPKETWWGMLKRTGLGILS